MPRASRAACRGRCASCVRVDSSARKSTGSPGKSESGLPSTPRPSVATSSVAIAAMKCAIASSLPRASARASGTRLRSHGDTLRFERAHEIRWRKQRDDARALAQSLQASDRQVSGISGSEANDPNEHAVGFARESEEPHFREALGLLRGGRCGDRAVCRPHRVRPQPALVRASGTRPGSAGHRSGCSPCSADPSRTAGSAAPLAADAACRQSSSRLFASVAF